MHNLKKFIASSSNTFKYSVFFILLIPIYFFLNNVQKYEFESTVSNLESRAESEAKIIESLIDSYVDILVLSAQYFVDFDADPSTYPKALSTLVRLNDFNRIIIITPDGKSYSSKGEEFTSSNTVYTNEMKLGQTYIQNTYYDEVCGPSIAVNVPILDNNKKILGYIVGILTTKQLSKLFIDLFAYDLGYFHILDDDGQYIATNAGSDVLIINKTFYDILLSTVDFDNGYSSDKIKNDFANRVSGHTSYKVEEVNRLAYYAPIGINNWYFYSAVHGELTTDSKSNFHISNAFALLLLITLIFVGLIYWIYLSQKKLRENSALYENNIKTLAEQIDKIIFEWDLDKSEIKLINKSSVLSGREYTSDDYGKNEVYSRIHEDDHHHIFKIKEEISEGKSAPNIKIRLRIDNEYRWFNISAIPVFDKNNDYTGHAFGMLEDIDFSMNESINLKMKSEIDLLSGLYNKVTTEKLIKEVLENSNKEHDKYTLLIIDVDNFKNLNDSLGHITGDRVIKELAAELKKMFREDDIIGRIGGDEFFVFIKNSMDQNLILQKAQKVNTAFTKTYSNENKSVVISASIGVANYPNHGVDFETLYMNADIALYNRKADGKEGYTVYDENLNKQLLPAT